MITEIVYLARDNTIDLQLLSDGRVVSLASVTRIDVVDKKGTWSVTSVEAPHAFDWSAGNGMVILSFGLQNIPPGNYICLMVVYDQGNPHGIVWDEVTLVAKHTVNNV